MSLEAGWSLLFWKMASLFLGVLLIDIFAVQMTDKIYLQQIEINGVMIY